MAKSGRTYTNQSISFPPAMLAAAKKRAGNLRLSFSAYVQKCIERDLLDRHPIVFQEHPEPAAAEDSPSGSSSRRR